jgi:hypothetical protein
MTLYSHDITQCVEADRVLVQSYQRISAKPREAAASLGTGEKLGPLYPAALKPSGNLRSARKSFGA